MNIVCSFSDTNVTITYDSYAMIYQISLIIFVLAFNYIIRSKKHSGIVIVKIQNKRSGINWNG